MRLKRESKKRWYSLSCAKNTIFYVIGNCDAISYYIKTLREDAQTAEMELIAAQYHGRARVLQAKLFVPLKVFSVNKAECMHHFLIFSIYYSINILSKSFLQ